MTTNIRRAALLLAAVLVLACGPALAQYREYHLSGQVVDTAKKPLEGVDITLRDVETSRSYSFRTKKDGTFKFAGLPHGIYKVVFRKEGFAVKEDEWKFETPQDQMQRVEIPPVVLASQEVLQEAERMKEAAAEVKLAAEQIRTGSYDAALAALKTVLDKNPQDSNALYLSGLAYLKKKMWPEARTALAEVTRLAPKFPAGWYQMGVAYQQAGETEPALEAYRRAMELDPANPDAPYNAGLLLFTASKVDDALAMFEKALAIRPGDPAFLEMTGRCWINKGDFAKAIDYLEKAKAGYAGDAERAKFLDDLVAKLKEQIKK